MRGGGGESKQREGREGGEKEEKYSYYIKNMLELLVS